MRLDGAHVLVTGASRGIGAQVAEQAAARGAQVTLVARSAEALELRAARLGGYALPVDLADADDRVDVVQRAEDRAGRPVDVLVNAAGVDASGAVLAVGAATMAAAFKVNLVAAAELCRQVAPGMVARRRGRLVNLSSLASTVVTPGLAAYSGSKAGLSHFTGVLRAELAGTGVGTTLVEIGPVCTELYRDIVGDPVAGPSMRRFVRTRAVSEMHAADVAGAMLDAVEAGREHVVLPRRAVPVLALTWLPRRASQLFLSGLPKR